MLIVERWQDQELLTAHLERQKTAPFLKGIRILWWNVHLRHHNSKSEFMVVTPVVNGI
jgi:hypothetical protein